MLLKIRAMLNELQSKGKISKKYDSAISPASPSSTARETVKYWTSSPIFFFSLMGRSGIKYSERTGIRRKEETFQFLIREGAGLLSERNCVTLSTYQTFMVRFGTSSRFERIGIFRGDAE